MAEMNKKTFGAAAIVATLLSVGTYVLLNTLLPYKPEELKVAEGGDLDEIMSGSLSTTAPEGHAASDTQSIPAAETAPAETATEMAADTDAQDAATTDATTDVAAADTGAASEPAAEPAPAPEPAAEPAQVAAAEPAPAPAVEAAPAPAPKPKKAKPAAKSPAKSPAHSGTATAKQYAPAKDLKQWWGTAADGSLSVAYAGSLANKNAVVLMFTGAFDSADSINQHVKVKSSGGAVGGKWEISPNNKRMALFTVPAKGRYLISVSRGVTDRSGRKLGGAVQGPVYVQ